MVKRSEKMLRLPSLVKNYPHGFFAYVQALILKKNFLTIYELKDGTKMLIHARGPDRGLLLQIWLNDVYTKFFDLSKFHTVIDIGAHIGTFTIYAAKKARRVIAFEPAQENFAVLTRNIELNKLQNVKPHKMAVWNAHTKITLYLHPNSSANTIFDASDRTEEVKCITLADILDMEKLDSVDLVKIDSEKCELDTILSSDKTVLKRIQNFVIECEDFEVRDKIAWHLQSHGFTTAINPDVGYGHILFATATSFNKK